MPFVLVHHKVEDFDTWKPQFDDHSGARKRAGSKGGQLFRSADDPNDVVLLLEWDSVEAAKEFVQSLNIEEFLKQHGIVGEATILFLEPHSRPSA